MGTEEFCVCDWGFTAGDCSERICPSGRAWVDFAVANNSAHAMFFECSNMGYCDRSRGECACREGFDGEACDRLRCPLAMTDYGLVECSGRGRCLSMREAAFEVDYEKLFSERVVYDDWDADMVYGCVCDVGFAGYDCSLRQCIKGDDPMTEGKDEVQLIECILDNESDNGTFTVTFRGQRTRDIPLSTSPELLEAYLEELTTISDVEIDFFSDDAATKYELCESNGTTAVVTFVSQNGDLPAMNLSTTSSRSYLRVVANDGAPSILRPTMVVSVDGTREDEECSKHGSCRSGLCVCYRGFSDSNGRGQKGHKGDCGFMSDENATVNGVRFYDPNATDAPCPVAEPLWDSSAGPLICSGGGSCLPDRTCNCTEGYFGSACEYKACPDAGKLWFDEATNDNMNPHKKKMTSSLECSNRGLCDWSTGTCACDDRFDLFEGDACELLSCYRSVTDLCSGHGSCRNMQEFAEEAELFKADGTPRRTTYEDPWDANMMRGCLCDKNEGLFDYNTSSTTYRGPFAMAYTDWTGYSCARAFCPTGDNPSTHGDVDEIQRINCTASRGSFNVTFRGSQPPAEIPWWAPASKIQADLEKLPTIRAVDVRFVHFAQNNHSFKNDTACADGQLIEITFRSERGDLPLLALDATDLLGSVNVSEHAKGTKENLECSANGICNRDHGQCNCLDGHYSGSDRVPFRHRGAIGQRGDCSFRHTSTDKEQFHNPNFDYSYIYFITAKPLEDTIEGDEADDD